MGWNDVRISLVPAGWKIIAEFDETAHTPTGSPVTILRTIPDPEHTARPIDPLAVRELLEREGFEVSVQGSSFLRMTRGEIEALFDCEQGTLSEILLTFTLDQSSLARIPEWQRFIGRLLESDGLAVVDWTTLERVDHLDFVRVLTNLPNWREFAERYGWPGETRGSGALIPSA